MGIITDVNGTKVYFVPTATATATPAECATAISNGIEAGYLLNLGDLSTTKSIQQYDFLTGEGSLKSVGSESYGNFTIEAPFNASDTAGQQELMAIFRSNTRRKMVLKMTDDDGATPSYGFCNIVLSGETMSFQKDNAVMLTHTIEQDSSFEVISAT